MTGPLRPGSVRLMLIRDVDSGAIVDADVFFTADDAEHARAGLVIGLDGEFRDYAPDPPADVLTGAEQLALPPGCQCSYVLSHADGRWHLITRKHCAMHGYGMPGAAWKCPRCHCLFERPNFEHEPCGVVGPGRQP
jgi:hypothetical protein